jgi:hypothetical protein
MALKDEGFYQRIDKHTVPGQYSENGSVIQKQRLGLE